MSEFRKKIIIQVVATIGAIGLVAIFIFYIAGNIGEFETKIALERADAAFRSRALSNLNELKRDEAKATQYINPLKNALPSKVGLFVFQGEVERMARDRGLAAKLTFVSEEEGGPIANKAKFSLEVNGDYQMIMRFIKDLEASRYFTSFDQFEISSQGGVASTYQVKINGSVFFK